jgi:hypothetical protein
MTRLYVLYLAHAGQAKQELARRHDVRGVRYRNVASAWGAHVTIHTSV